MQRKNCFRINFRTGRLMCKRFGRSISRIFIILNQMRRLQSICKVLKVLEGGLKGEEGVVWEISVGGRNLEHVSEFKYL